jgi:hypothetical protein
MAFQISPTLIKIKKKEKIAHLNFLVLAEKARNGSKQLRMEQRNAWF